ncbi:MAG: hypothetical protein HZB53_07620 [Chloroflexi bacterium]|nr:hypothetical protein [Chloroflexota bacterium]
MKRPIRALCALALALLLLGGLTPIARAVDTRSGESVVIGAGEVIDDDLMLFASNVVFNGTVNGNLIAFGTRVEINGTVNGNVMAAGQAVTLNGAVRDSVYVAGQSLMMGSKAAIGRNASVGGFGLQVDAGSAIARDLQFGGYQALLNGTIGRDLRFAGGALELCGKVGRDIVADVGEPGAANTPPVYMGPYMPTMVNPGLRIAPTAVIGGKLAYSSPVEQAGAIMSAPTGGVSFRLQPRAADRPQAAPDTRANYIWGRARELMTLLVLALLAAWLAPTVLAKASEQAQARPLQAAGWGLVMLIGGFMLAIFAGIALIVVGIVAASLTFGGLANPVFGTGFMILGLAFSLFLMLIAFGSKLVCAHLIGRVVLRPFNLPLAAHRLWPLLVGVVTYVLLASIPLLDVAVSIIVTLVGLGAMWYVYKDRRNLLTPTPQAAAPLAMPGTPKPVMG